MAIQRTVPLDGHAPFGARHDGSIFLAAGPRRKALRQSRVTSIGVVPLKEKAWFALV